MKKIENHDTITVVAVSRYIVLLERAKGVFMKGTLLVIFSSKHGYVKRYVDIIGNALGCDAVPLKKLNKTMLGYDRFLYISSVRNGAISEFKKIVKYLDAIGDRLVVCGVGMLPRNENTEASLKSSTIPVDYEAKLPVFYAQGGFDVAELSGTEKMQISMIERQVKAASMIDADGTFLLNAIATPVDEVKTAHVKHLIDYLDGKNIDAKLYSPPTEQTE